MSISITNLERSLLFRRFLSAFDEPQADILADTLGLIAGQIRGEFATREDIQDLKESIRELAEAQARTEERLQKYQEASEARFARIEAALDRLAEAQARTEEEFRQYRESSEARFARIEAALDRLAEAQARTEEGFRQYRESSEARFTRIEAALDRLAEAQARTEAQVRELSEAQARTEAQVRELAEAQARTERKVDKLARQVGGLSETVGGDIEDIAYIVIHRVLQREKGWQVGELKRVWQNWDGRKREVNIFGEARDPARPEQRIWIVGEAKHNLTMREVEKFARTVDMARRNLEGEIFPVCFCYRARPEVQERIRELGFHIVFSYGELVESGGDR